MPLKNTTASWLMPALLAAALLTMPGAMARAAGGTPEYTLDWDGPREVLAYRSCGCGDACWRAQVRSTVRPRQVKATLRCDCEKLLFALGPGPADQVYQASCQAMEGDDKPAVIKRELERILGR